MVRSTPLVAIFAGFGLVVLASGLWRALAAPGGAAGLWFGVVNALLLFGAAGDTAWGNPRRGRWLATFAWAVVVSWFSYETTVRKGIVDAELRQGLVLVCAAVAAWLYARAVRSSPPAPLAQR